ncbi:sialate O-acetylesterase [Aureispira anguillae]|uniref:T9SS type A sorting domain-containing protein n=1 Tax=Aureispira anguillae TaxID=2864201 RepID=A0A915YBD0_9BACT|nr:sialate O-acetylesterase [Aureispira anguillae]BDS09959.1 T9SS type A sorting domain-containing protein [Aureispira anguillae]
MIWLKTIILFLLLMPPYFNLIAQIQYFKDINGIRLYPQSHQLYPRDVNNKAAVIIKGVASNITSNVNNIELLMIKRFLDGSTQNYSYTQITNDSFSFAPILEAGMYLYDFQILLKKNKTLLYRDTIAQDVVCGDAYIIAGQSNAMGVGTARAGIIQDSLYQAYSKNLNAIYSKSLGNMPNYNGTNGFLTNYDANNNYWFPANASDSNLIGFVGFWGLKLQYLIQDQYQMPTCFINGAYGGTNIAEHQLYASPTSNPRDLRTLFGALTYRIEQANLKNNIKGIIWYQGESQNTYERAYTYADSLNYLIDDWEQHWGSVEKIYIVQIHTGCNYHGFGQIVREQQRTIDQLTPKTNLIPLTANGIGERRLAANDPNYQCHFSRDAYNELSERLFQVIGRDFYAANTCITSPNIINAYYNYDKLVLEFDQDLADCPNGLEHSFAFYKDNILLPNFEPISMYSKGHKIYMTISNNSPNAVSYLLKDDPIYNNEMIWLTNPEGYAAFSFHQFPIHIDDCSSKSISITSNLIGKENLLEIELKSCNLNKVIKIYSVQGQLLYQKNIPFINIRQSIDLSHFAAGVYFLIVENNHQIITTRKLVKY